MSKVVKNYSELFSSMQNILQSAINEVSADVEILINDFIEEWYRSYNPTSYKRTYKFLNSCTRVEARVKGNEVIASVFIDTNYTYPDNNDTLAEVAMWANEGFHGDPSRQIYTENEFWNDAIKSLNYGKIIQFNFAEYLKFKGFNVVIK